MHSDASNGIVAALAALDAPVRDMLAEDLPQQLATVREALDAGDLARARLDVHAVRGSAAFCKLAGLYDAAAALETSLLNNEKNAEKTRAFQNNIENILHALEHAKTTDG
ncbi:MAG TPA: Hpt domain-containing protein [Gammaproteobacteria bacterium]